MDNAVSLSGRSCTFGIPTFINSFFNKAEFDWGNNAANLCEKSLTKLYVLDSTGVDSAHWEFDDPATGAKNKAKGFTVYHTFSKPATFNVFLQLYRAVPSSACYADTARKKLTIFANPKVSLGRDTVICAGEDVVLADTTKTTTGRSYEWSDNSTVPNYIAKTKGWHWLEVKVGGCIGSDSVYLDVISYPKFNIGNDTLICSTDSIKLTASGGKRYLWSTGDTISTVFAKKAGMVWARASNGRCYTYDTLFISHSSAPHLYLGRDSVLCSGDSITLNAKTQNSKKYEWSDLSTDSFLLVKTTGTYWARIKDTLCYSLRDTIKVTFQSKFKLDLGKDTTICKGGSYLINAAVAGGKSWLWHNSSTGTTFSATTPGIKYVKVSNGICAVSDTINIAENSIAPISLGKDTTLCIGSSLDIIKSPISGIEYTWMGTVKNYSYPIKTTGKYYVELRDLPKKVCKVSDTIVVTFKAGTKINLGNDTLLCLGQLVDLDVSKYGLKSYTWWDNSTSPAARKNDNTRVKHFVTGYDGICVTTDTINISYRPVLSVGLGPDIDLCDNATQDFNITTSSATQYEWISSTGTTLATSPTYTINSPGGKFVAKVSDGFCPKYDTINVNYNTTPVVNIGADLKVCDDIPNPAIFDASASAATSYMWNNGDTTDKITVTTQGKYWVDVANGKCTASDSAWAFFADSPQNDFGFADSVFCDIPNLNFDFSQPNTTFLWDNGSTLPTRKIRTFGQFWLIAENMCGRDSIGVTIRLNESGCRLNFPTAFSPNGDGINDLWRPTGEVIEWVEMVVYNRWGEAIYKGNPFNGWDGIVGGKYVQDGVYTMTVSYRKSEGGYPRLFFKNMTLTIIK